MLTIKISAEWQKSLSILAVLLFIFGTVYWQSWASIVSIWERSGTFAHGFFVLPFSLWLIWQKRAIFGQFQPVPSCIAALVLFGCGFVWLLADLARVLVVEQFALVGMLLSIVWSVLGNRVCSAILFPLCFLFLMVPFGEDFVPYLMEYTASFVVMMLRLTGISVYREGMHFFLSSGHWSVVEACSGIRYLIASITLGLVYAYLNYTSYKKRAFFVLLAILVPILANGLRAYMIVMIGHLSDMKLATGVDHIIYGWIFFGFVMLVLFYSGSFWVDPPVSPEDTGDQVLTETQSWGVCGLTLTSVIVLCGFLLWPMLSDERHARQNIKASVPETLMQGLLEVSIKPDWSWFPQFTGVMAQNQYFVSENDQLIGIYYANFGNEISAGELVNSQNTLIRTEQRKEWRIVKESLIQLPLRDQLIKVEESSIAGPGEDYLVMRWYLIGDVITFNHYYAKWLQLLKRLEGDASAELMVVIYTPTDHANLDEARKRLLKVAAVCCSL